MAGLNGVKTELSQAQLQILADEINNDPQGKGYLGCTRGGIVKLLNEKPLVDNPQAQQQIDGPPLVPGRILREVGITLSEINAAKADADGATIWEVFMRLPEIDLNSDLANECLAALQSKGLLSTEKVQAVQALGKIPDPAWQAQIPGISRAEELLGAGYTVEGVDISEALAL